MDLHQLSWSPSVEFYSDASGSWGCGAVCKEDWLQLPWAGCWTNESIATKELLPIIMACALWGLRWQHRWALVHCDNMAVVSILKSLTSKDHNIICTHTFAYMHLLRCLHFFCAIFDISIRAQHVSGVNNILADAVSRDHLQVLFERAPWLNPVSTPVPNALLLLLVHTRPDWLSDTWRQLLLDSLNTVWPKVLDVLRGLASPDICSFAQQ